MKGYRIIRSLSHGAKVLNFFYLFRRIHGRNLRSTQPTQSPCARQRPGCSVARCVRQSTPRQWCLSAGTARSGSRVPASWRTSGSTPRKQSLVVARQVILWQFSHQRQATRHERTHTGKKPYACSVCPMRFSNKSAVPRHERTHTGEKPYACSMCPIRFTNKSTVAPHERTHTGEKPYACSMCPRRFTNKSHVVPHERTHTGEKPYACFYCGKTFAESGTARSHVRTQHQEPV